MRVCLRVGRASVRPVAPRCNGRFGGLVGVCNMWARLALAIHKMGVEEEMEERIFKIAIILYFVLNAILLWLYKNNWGHS